MKKFFLIFLIFLIFSCKSTRFISEKFPDQFFDPKTGMVYKKSLKQKDGKVLIETEIKGKKNSKKKYWVKRGFKLTSLSHLSLQKVVKVDLNNPQLSSEVIFELSSRGRIAIPYLIKYLDSDLEMVLPENLRKLKWYENKSDFQVITQGLYVAYYLQGILNHKPRNIFFKVYKKHNILFAEIEGEGAVKKAEVIQAWQAWWQTAQKQWN